MKIIAGLGNPGLRYKNTRHNIGFMVLDEFAGKHGIRIKQKAFHGLCGVGRFDGEEVFLVKPLTFMNLSGEAVDAVCQDRLKNKEDLLVVCDDFNLPLGEIRLREKGSSGGHNGLESIIGIMGEDFARLRVGIGAEVMPVDRSDYVLGPFLRKERPILKEAVIEAVLCVETWISKGSSEAMKACN